MNGLEAIKAMMEGRLVARFICFGTERAIYKIIDGNVFCKNEEFGDGTYLIEDRFNFDEEYHEYKDPELFKGWERVEEWRKVYFISVCEGVLEEQEKDGTSDRLCYENANYFSTREKAEEIDFKQTLFRRMQRFSDENGGNKIDWTHEGRRQYFISYDYDKGEFVIDSHLRFRDFGQVYFVSLDVARKALELFKEDLIKYFTYDWSKGE